MEITNICLIVIVCRLIFVILLVWIKPSTSDELEFLTK